MPYLSWSIVLKSSVVGVFLYLASMFLFFNKGAGIFVFAALILIFFLKCLKNIKYGLALIIIELIVSSHGRLITLPNSYLSLRISWFAILMIIFFVHYLRRKEQDGLKYLFPKPLIAVFIMVVIGFLNGFLRSHDLSKVFFDGNGYLYLLIIPVFLFVLNRDKGEGVKFFISLVMGSLIALSLAILAIFFVFSNVYLEDFSWIYKWARDTRLSEITWAGGNYFRIFLPSQIWLIPGVFLAWQLYKDSGYLRHLIFSSLFLAGLFFSLSRSFGVGLLFGFAVCFFLFFKRGIPIKRSLAELFFILSLSAYIVGIAINVPGNVGGIGGDILKSRISGFEEPGIKSRLSQIQPLLNAIKENPVLGSGFGREVTYISYDPRVRKTQPDGLYTTFAFEWGYLDLLLKLGIVGFGVIAYFLVKLTRGLNNIKEYGWVWVAGLVVILVTHAFSPYLNHPLGLGYIAFVLSLINAQSNNNNTDSNA